MKTEQLILMACRHSIFRMLLSPALSIRRYFIGVKQSYREEILRNLAESCINDPVINVAEFNGHFRMDVRSDIFRRTIQHKCYEPELASLSIKYMNPARDIIDVGANIGLYTVLFAKRINNDRKVLAVEPTANALNRLLANIELNGVAERVKVFEGVVSDRHGTLEIKTVRGKEEYSSLGAMTHPAIASCEYVTEKVKSMTLDELVEMNSLDPGFLKVDAEGCEHLIFQGAGKLLEVNRPIILSEVSDLLLRNNGSSAQDLIKLIKSYDYDVVDPLNKSARINEIHLEEILCFPREMNISQVSDNTG
jgi:FkbM family methyltransferase